MANVHDVATYILQKNGRMSAMKLEKLVYYSQAWSLVWDDAALFPERIEAWVNGPVVPALYYQHRGKFDLDSWNLGNPNALTPSQKGTVNAVLNYYGAKSPGWLSELTHNEDPWKKARKGLAPLERGNNEITLESMAEYYSSI